jgi:predicted CXXCH cytochrome family protein
MKCGLAALVLILPLGAQEAGRIVRPADLSALVSGELEIIATAPAGKLHVDGKAVAAEEPFPNVFRSVVQVGPGIHKVVLVWDGGRKEITVYAGPNAPAGFVPFLRHPPQAVVTCKQCHELSNRGRFRFRNGSCFECHADSKFVPSHHHEQNVLAECGLCHNAHGSTVKGHLLYPKEQACKLCHN